MKLSDKGITQALEAGRRIRRAAWNGITETFSVIALDKNKALTEFYMRAGEKTTVAPVAFELEDIAADDWEVLTDNV